MLAIDLDAYWDFIRYPSSEARAAIRIMQWSNYVKRRLGPDLTAAQEFELLAKDAEVMGEGSWWK